MNKFREFRIIILNDLWKRLKIKYLFKELDWKMKVKNDYKKK
jgi:hypothetical protein